MSEKLTNRSQESPATCSLLPYHPPVALAECDSPLGTLTIFANDFALTGLAFTEERYPLDRTGLVAQHHQSQPSPLLLDAIRQVHEYFQGFRRSFDLPLAPRGTDFQRSVWTTLLGIPFGETWSYLQLAQAIGNPKATRAVGLANGKNPLAILIPCHRVVGSDGSLTGYGGGVARKESLLRLEGFPVRRTHAVRLQRHGPAGQGSLSF
jgi:methylated-DNA-[protein]-cysteine S-methyltransferase